ncbi:MAG: 2-oxoacid ferredoxin oxidoreductase [Desulfarculaceae bacterium]|nr:2-oxoacid ferredoxin oxidoreductase [Desulfarculaceae bacterium]MCF8071371.1 2-oxoacid ferredoxin oxidoreductase [Desulfarculaceae bacterium]MCF8101696.1 2-oxoacid ferredoxin oxidoreductase [Desulfarculaceae bacterium]MCF8116695.1 2-oxoacid ferredoxin oxidoreductase [Desulfarculaceae bacterium]
MVKIEDYGEIETAWCPGCGNFGIRKALVQALVEQGLAPKDILLVSGIGQAAKTPHYIPCNAFNGLHGRGLPAATGASLAHPGLKVILTSGDGCNYGEGGNHFLAGLRRNVDLTMLVHDNQIYGLTKGQASPTSLEGMHTKAQPHGVHLYPFNPVAVAVSLHVGFVARGFAGEQEHLAGLISQAMQHKGLSVVDILQPCVSFNKLNTYEWYKKRVRMLGQDEHDPSDWDAAIKLSYEFGDSIPLGVIYANERPSFQEFFPVLEKGPLAAQDTDYGKLGGILESYA